MPGSVFVCITARSKCTLRYQSRVDQARSGWSSTRLQMMNASDILQTLILPVAAGLISAAASATLQIDVKIDNLIMAEKMARLTIIVVDGESRVVEAVAAYHKIPANSTRIEFVRKSSIKTPRLWHGVQDPHLYRYCSSFARIRFVS